MKFPSTLFATLLNTALDALLPDTCILCGQTQAQQNTHLLCHFCWAALPRNVCCCSRCAQPLQQPGVCGGCQLRAHTADMCIVPLLHEAESRFLVHQLKFSNGFRAGRTLSATMLQSIRRFYDPDQLPECLVPVPLSFRRQTRRGYNQAAWLAHGICRELALPVFYGPIKRRHGPSQQALSKHARLGLAKDTFQLRRRLPYRHVAIVDDVLTTGTTTRVLSDLLHKRGAARVDIWCATRAVLP